MSFSSELVTGQLDGIQPCSWLQVAWWLLLRFQIEIATTFQIDRDIIVGQFLVSDQDLEDDQQQECGLVSLIETSVDVVVDLISRGVDDVLDSFKSGSFLGDINRVIEDIEELLQRGVVHPFDENHLDNAEIQDRSSDGSWSILLSLGVNLLSLLFSNGQKIGDFFGGSLGLVQHLDELSILNKVTGWGREFQEKFLIEFQESLLIVRTLLEERFKIDLELLLLFGQDSTQKLLLKTGLGDSEIDDQSLGGELWGELGVWNSGEQEHIKVIIQGDILLLDW